MIYLLFLVIALMALSFFLIGYSVGLIAGQHRANRTRDLPITEKRKNLIAAIERLVSKREGVEIIFPDPMKEKFDAGTVTSISDVLE